MALRAASDNGGEGNGLELNGLLEQPVEKQAAVVRAAPVEAEGELRQVALEVLGRDGASVGAEQPALEQRGHQVDARHDHVRRVADARDRGRVVGVAELADAVVAAVAVGQDDRSRLDRLLDERLQALGLDVRDWGDPDAAGADAVLLDGDGGCRLLAAPRPRLPAATPPT